VSPTAADAGLAPTVASVVALTSPASSDSTEAMLTPWRYPALRPVRRVKDRNPVRVFPVWRIALSPT
jgi:hypothetical protein